MARKRKTRQEKIIAELRRQLATGKTKDFEMSPAKRDLALPENEKLDIEVRSEKKETEKSNLPFPSPASHLPSFTSISLIKKDLTKTFVLTILAISLELVLYFWLG